MCRRISWMDALGAFSKMSNQQRLVILTTFAIWAFWLLGFVCTQMDFKEEERFCCCPGLTDEVSEKPVDPNDPWKVNNNRILRISLNTSVLIDNETVYLGTLSRNFSRLSEWIWIITNLDSCLSCYYRLINLQMSWHPFQLRESTTVREKQEILDPYDCLFSFSPFNLSTFFITSLLMSISLTVCVARPGYTHNSFHPSTIQLSVTRLFCLWCVSVLLLLDLLCWVSQLRPDALLRTPLPSLPPPYCPY